MNDRELFDRWKSEPFPLLPILHAFHDRDGSISRQALHSISEELRIPLAELHGTVSFYHHFSQEDGAASAPRVCTGPICRQHGADELLASLKPEGACAMPCSGRCDEPIPVLFGRETRVGTKPAELAPKPSPLPAPNPAGAEECVFRSIRAPGRAQLGGYVESGGFSALQKAANQTADAILEVLDQSRLAGRGGAGFPTARKWRAVLDESRGPKSIVCNADEGEPGCFKDRALLDHDPFAVIEGMAIGALATGATRGFIYLRYEYPETATILERALQEAERAGWIGANFAGSGREFQIHLRIGAGSYVCGEETALLESLEGRRPLPRNRPPYPVTHGLEDLPTVINNVETFAAVAPILTHGAAWYCDLGLGDHAGTKIISLSGDVRRPGNYEVPMGLPLRTLLDDWAGGPHEGREIKAVTMAGLSGGFLAGDALNVTLDEPSIRAHDSFLGAGGIMVFDDRRDLVEFATEAMAFFAHESCGKCFPCRIGTQRLTERLSGAAGPKAFAGWVTEVEDIQQAMRATSACGLGVAAPLITESLLRWCPDAVRNSVEGSSS